MHNDARHGRAESRPGSSVFHALVKLHRRGDAMSYDGYFVIDADGHGGEPLDWRRRIPASHLDAMIAYVSSMKQTFADMPGGGVQMSEANPREFAPAPDPLDFDAPMREGMSTPSARLDDMDLEGLDVTVMFPPGSGEEW